MRKMWFKKLATLIFSFQLQDCTHMKQLNQSSEAEAESLKKKMVVLNISKSFYKEKECLKRENPLRQEAVKQSRHSCCRRGNAGV